MSVHLILYSKPGCHLCEGLQEKLAQIQSLDLDLEVRDITTRDDWFQTYQYEIPVLVLVERQEAEGRRQEVGGAGEAEGAGEAGEAIQTSNLSNLSAHLRSGSQRASATQTSNLKPSSHRKTEASYISLPRPSPRATVPQLEQLLRKYL